MDWKAALVTFAVVFLAEIGDKTQLMVMSMAARSRTPYIVFFGAVAALAASSLIAVLCGEAFLRAVPPKLLKFGTGIFFAAIGLMLLYRSFD